MGRKDSHDQQPQKNTWSKKPARRAMKASSRGRNYAQPKNCKQPGRWGGLHTERAGRVAVASGQQSGPKTHGKELGKNALRPAKNRLNGDEGLIEQTPRHKRCKCKEALATAKESNSGFFN